MNFVIPMMFYSCLQWPLHNHQEMIRGFRFEQCVTIEVGDGDSVFLEDIEFALPGPYWRVNQ